MNLLNKYVSFALIVILLAIMDGLNFIMPHDAGFYSLTSGYFDAWHLSKFIILLIIGIQFIWVEDKWQINMLRLCALGFIALAGQLLIYNFMFKLGVL